jgi:hypothetical protein
MPNWNRILVGDAFRVQQAGINYYRDLFLTWPFLGFSVAATSFSIAPESPADRTAGLKWALCAVVVLLLAKERRLLAMGASGYVFIRAAFYALMGTGLGRFSIHTPRTREAPLWALVSGAAVLALFLSDRLWKWKPSYVFPRKFYLLDMIVGVSGLASMLLVAHWVKP